MSRFWDHSPVVPSFSELIRQFGNRAGHTWGTVGAHLGHKIVFPGAHLGHTLGTVGAQLGQKVTWGTLGAEAVGAHLGHTWGTLGAHLGHSWGKKVT